MYTYRRIEELNAKMASPGGTIIDRGLGYVGTGAIIYWVVVDE